ncbi:protein mono-ADP-ribosyltransferase PARP12b [Dicentrarchus labrax]|uniref:Poly (ADP-ribose) polymerase family, member 12b n=1 Tax=Dicentrarchus labrax TaxID=13489 RepID=A0A8P4G467_DICLA|nr:protein mono-ADP-ribosyltransferase PARP12b [Dicentrarchus labrax]
MYSREVLAATSLLCGSSGAMQPLQLHRKLLQRCDISEKEFNFIIQQCPRFLLVRGPAAAGGERLEDCTVVARTDLRLCARYGRDECTGSGREGGGDCQQLHLCKFFIYGNCRFGKGRKSCKFSHDIRSDHNYRLLREFTLHELNEDDLFVLLLQNDPSLLPEVCSHYNRGSGPHGSCTFQESCTKVHLCQHFVQGDCMFGLKCKRQHAIDQHGRRMLEERGLSGDIIRELPFMYRNIHHLAAAAAASTSTENLTDSSWMPQTDDRNNICLHFIRNSCKFQNECRRVHFHLPYKWEVFDGVTWTDLQHMEDIERDFCDPSKTQSCSNHPIDFQTMRQGLQPVRRLSTVSSVTKPPHYTLTTQWLWYYKGDQGNWVEYGLPDEKQRSTSVSSRMLEEVFLSNRTADVKVAKGQRQYVISFKDMYQRNHKHNTKRRVRRRPRFVSMAEVERQAVQ